MKKVYNIGIAQKLLNLQLKYLWCAGFIGVPPHCPVDRIIISKTYLRDRFNWTQIDGISEYQKAIEAIRSVAQHKSIAVWELENYDR